ncbi:hypothetical protein CLU79DRAFT_840397 [Phycomyces nitens]|nr:hypothetical protein CLU79DRAFT_840397 [Phycomyces nitens]
MALSTNPQPVSEKGKLNIPNSAPLSNIDRHSDTWDGVNASLHNRIHRPIVQPNKVLPLFTSPGNEVLINQDAITAAWTRTMNPTCVVFNVGKIASDNEFCEVMVQQLWPAASYIPR